jgi:hypothetical protein
MTRTCCTRCRLRFAPVTVAHLVICPSCAGPLELLAAEAALGFRLTDLDELPVTYDAEAVSAALPAWLPAPDPGD